VRIGIGLPTRASAVPGQLLVEWSTRADSGPFSSLAVSDRVVYDAQEPLVALAAAIGVTRRIRLLTSIVIVPTRETTLLARQAASIDALSGGRLTLGVGIGVRQDDYGATGRSFHGRGRRLETQLATLRRIWAGQPLADGIGAIGPAPARTGGPEVLIGGYVDAVARRVAAWGDGFMSPGGGEPARMRELWRLVLDAWVAAGRPGRPRWVSGSYYALGPSAEDAATEHIRAWYGSDPQVAERRRRGIPTTPRAVMDAIERQADMGVDEYILRSCAADIEHLERLEDVVAGRPSSRASG